MFTKITLENYRTHKCTTLELKPITLLIGNNNSGKTNFLTGIQHFSWLIRRGNPYRENEDISVHSKDYFPHRYRLADDQDSMAIDLHWTNQESIIEYRMELYLNQDFSPQNVGCREKIAIKLEESQPTQTRESGYESSINQILLRKKIVQDKQLDDHIQRICDSFFRDFAYTFSYHLQPSFLKGIYEKNSLNKFKEQSSIKIPSSLGYEGQNFQPLIYYVKEHEERVFSRFITLMRRFERSFQNVRYDSKQSRLLWEFDLGRKTLDRLVDQFSADVVSDGFIKAAAISLLVSLQKPPSLMLIEEIENGINPGNIQELMSWLWQATSPNQKDYTPQFIITSHSPSVLREFHNHLDSVYTVRLNKRNYQSDVRNLNDALDTLVGIGTVEGEILEDEKTGKRLVEIPKYQLAELWYSGTIG